MAIGTDRKDGTARSAVACVDVPPKSAPGGTLRWSLDAGHQLDRFRFEDPNAIELSAIEQHPSVPRQGSGGRKETSVAGHTAHVPRGRVMHDPTIRFATHHLRRGNSREFAGVRQ